MAERIYKMSDAAGGWARCSRKCFGGSRRMQATAAILGHACERSSMPCIPAALLCRRVVEVLPAFGMDGEIPDEWTGRRGIVTEIHASKDVDLEMEFGGEVSVYHSRLRTLGSLRR